MRTEQPSSSTLNIEQAREFTQALTGSASSLLDWRFIHDSAKDRPVRKQRGSVDEVWPTVMSLQAEGYGVFFNVHGTDGQGTRRTNMRSLRAVIADKDDGEFQSLPCEPSIIVNTSKAENGQYKQHVYFVLDAPQVLTDEASKLYSSTCRTLASKTRADPQVNDTTRVLRMPGTLHLKDRENPHLIECVCGEARYGFPEMVNTISRWQSERSEREIADEWIKKVRDAQTGRRNSYLFQAAKELKDLSMGGTYLLELRAVAADVGLASGEIEATIASACSSGESNGAIDRRAKKAASIVTRGKTVTDLSDAYVDHARDSTGSPVTAIAGVPSYYDSDVQCWREVDVRHVCRTLRNITYQASDKAMLSTHSVSVKQAQEILEQVRYTGIEVETEFHPTITCPAGTRSVRDTEWKPSGPEHYSTFYVPLSPGNAKAFNSRVFNYFDKHAGKKTELLKRFFGLCLYGMAPHGRSVVLSQGAGRNGKSTFYEAISDIFRGWSQDSSTNLRLEALNQDHEGTGMAALQKSRFNFSEEFTGTMSRGLIEHIKNLASGGYVSVRRRYEDSASVRSRAGFVIATNRPVEGSVDVAFWDRVLPVRFDRQFDVTSKSAADYKKEIVAQAADFFAWCVEGAQEAMADSVPYDLGPLAQEKERLMRSANAGASYKHHGMAQADGHQISLIDFNHTKMQAEKMYGGTYDEG